MEESFKNTSHAVYSVSFSFHDQPMKNKQTNKQREPCTNLTKVFIKRAQDMAHVSCTGISLFHCPSLMGTNMV